MDGAVVEAVRQSAPLIHCITNYVTANDVANLLLAAGARPVMADDPAEAAEITLAAQGLCLNLGTLHSASVPAMYAAGAAAASRGIPLVLDPVGAGSSTFRTQTARELTHALRPAVLRCNPTELTLSDGKLVYRNVSCRVQTARARKGMPYHPCKPVGLVEYAGFAQAIDDRIRCRCVSCYPEITDESCACVWEFTLEAE